MAHREPDPQPSRARGATIGFVVAIVIVLAIVLAYFLLT
jgi:tetrahydromethanopterin S-methyltransferase subunit F